MFQRNSVGSNTSVSLPTILAVQAHLAGQLSLEEHSEHRKSKLEHGTVHHEIPPLT
jgi:hypothetical protein